MTRYAVLYVWSNAWGLESGLIRFRGRSRTYRDPEKARAKANNMTKEFPDVAYAVIPVDDEYVRELRRTEREKERRRRTWT